MRRSSVAGQRRSHGITQHSGHRARPGRARSAPDGRKHPRREEPIDERREGDPGGLAEAGHRVRPVRASRHARHLTVEDDPDRARVRLRGTRSEHVRRDERAGHPLRCRRRDAVSRGARLRRPAAVPRPGVGPGAPVGRPNGAVHLRRPVVRRVAARRDASARVPAGAGEGPIDGFRAAPRVRVRVLPPHRRHPRAAVLRLPHLQHAPERLRADDPPDPRRDAAGRRRHHHRELRVRGVAVGDQLRARPRPRRPGQRVHVQERREGDREAGRLPRHVHDEAVAGLGRQRMPHAHLAVARGLGRERVRRRGRPAGH